MLINKLIFSVAETASLLNCSSHTIYKKIDAHHLKAHKIPGHHTWQITEKAIYDYMESQKRYYAPQSTDFNCSTPNYQA